jgi:hypothetical protein
MDVDLDPEQPDPVLRAIEALLGDDAPKPDPWWQAGIDESLGNS